MSLEDEIHKYLKYSADDFLLDDFFIRSIQDPDDYTEYFWSRFLKKNPANSLQYLEAKDFLLTIKESKNFTRVMPAEIKSELFSRIMTANKSNSKPKKEYKKYIWAAAASIAAAITVVMSLHHFWDTSAPKNDETSLLDYVKKVEDSIDFNSENILLKLSEDRIVTSELYDQEYSYSAENIVIADQEIPKKEVSAYNQLIVPFGKRSKLTLSDGTKIWVNAGTLVTYPVEFGKNSREIYVLGEVYLDVTHDPDRPFIVNTENFDVRVLGTKFNVSAYKNEPENVVLVSGSVKVSMTKNEVESTLQPNEIFRIENGESSIAKADVELYTSWVKGIFIFQNEKLDVLMKRLSKFSGKTIECSPAVENIKFSGKLNFVDSFDSILNNLSKGANIKYEMNGNHYKIY